MATFWRVGVNGHVPDCECDDPCSCECPEVSFTCESEQLNATMCGRRGYEVGSLPPSWIFYKSRSFSGNMTAERYSRCDKDVWTWTQEQTWYGTRSHDCDGGFIGWHGYDFFTTTALGETDSGTVYSSVLGGSSEAISETQRVWQEDGSTCYSNFVFLNGTVYETLSNPDTEADALERAESSIASGTSCSSRWEMRVASAAFMQRTSTYTLTLSKVRPNQDYRVTPEIRRREAFAGATDGAWEPVSVTPEDINFTAADPRWDEDEKTYTLDPVALPSIEGWEYQITGAEIEII